MSASVFGRLLELGLPPAGGAVVAIAEVYLDESGSHADSPIFVVAGYVFIRSKAQRFQREWGATLRRYQVPHFHMKDVAHLNGHFADWDRNRSIAFETELIALTKQYSAFGFSLGLSPRDFQAVFGNVEHIVGSMYTFCLRVVLGYVKEYFDKVSFQGSALYLFEAGHENASEANGMMQAIFDDPKNRDSYRYHGHAFLNKDAAHPLQCADLFAWLSRNWMLKLAKDPTAKPRQDLIALSRPHDQYRFYGAPQLNEIAQKFARNVTAVFARGDFPAK